MTSLIDYTSRPVEGVSALDGHCGAALMSADVNRDSPVPMWHQIELALERDIRSGAFLPGARLPNEESVAARFGVNRHTARRALATLAERGAVRIRRGLGTFVEHSLLSYPIVERTRFTAALQQQNRVATHTLLGASEVDAESDMAEALQLPPFSPVTILHVLGYADSVPVSVGVTAFSAERFPGLAARYEKLRSVTAVLAEFGLMDYRRATTRITAAMPSEEEAAHLRQARREPVLEVESVDVDGGGRPISFGRVKFAGGRVQLTVAAT